MLCTDGKQKLQIKLSKYKLIKLIDKIKDKLYNSYTNIICKINRLKGEFKNG